MAGINVPSLEDGISAKVKAKEVVTTQGEDYGLSQDNISSAHLLPDQSQLL
ncbi:MAG: hypothetical protein Q8870_02450 [Sweet potato little leaf phytoplasma]|nr:hypothetical protein [Sweet potato little leaf phytoplasma]